MRPVCSPEVESGGAELRCEFGLGVDPNVAADRLGSVVLVAEHPVDLLRPPRRNRRGEHAARLEHTDHLRDRCHVVLDVLEHLGGDHLVEASVGERQPGRVAAQHTLDSLVVDLAGIDHRVERGCCLDHFVVGVVECDDVSSSARTFEDVAAEAGADVEDAVARLQTEAIETDGQHVCADSDSFRCARCASTWRRWPAWRAPRGTARR